LSPCVSRDVIAPDEVNNCVSRIAPARQVKVAVDNARRGAAYRVGNRCALGERIRDGIILPCIWLGTADVPCVIATDQVDLAVGVVVSRSHETAHIWHIRAGGPCAGGNIVNPGDVVVGTAYGIFAAKNVNLVGWRVING
jgi:hypothetical protein